MPNRPYRDLGERLRAARKARHLTQETVAARIGVKREIISQWESGSRRPGQENLIKLATIYGISTDALYGIHPTEEADIPTPAPLNSIPEADTDWRRILDRLSRALEIQAEANLHQAIAHEEQAKATAEASRAAHVAIQALVRGERVPTRRRRVIFRILRIRQVRRRDKPEEMIH